IAGQFLLASEKVVAEFIRLVEALSEPLSLITRFNWWGAFSASGQVRMNAVTGPPMGPVGSIGFGAVGRGPVRGRLLSARAFGAPSFGAPFAHRGWAAACSKLQRPKPKLRPGSAGVDLWRELQRELSGRRESLIPLRLSGVLRG